MDIISFTLIAIVNNKIMTALLIAPFILGATIEIIEAYKERA